MLDCLQAEAVYAPIRVPWRVGQISDSGVGQFVVFCVITHCEAPRMPDVTGIVFSTGNYRSQVLGTVQGGVNCPFRTGEHTFATHSACVLCPVSQSCWVGGQAIGDHRPVIAESA